MQDPPAPPGDLERVEPAMPVTPSPTAVPEQLGTRATASALAPLVTAPMSVERPPRASGGPAAALVGINETLRKPGLRRGLALLGRLNQADGFVCPSCAWPTPDQRANWEVCESGARAVADEASLRQVGPRLFRTYTVPELGKRSDHWLSSQGRLTEPMIRRPDANDYEPISWDDAIALVGSSLANLSDPDRAVFYSSARLANEPAFCLQLLARALGTNNLASSSQLCHEASRVALAEVLGDARAAVGLADFDHAEAIFVWGSNPGSNHPRMLSTLRAAKARGAKIVAINPLREASLLRSRTLRKPRDWFGEGLEVADLLLPVKVAGDLALIIGISKALFEADQVDHEFLADRETVTSLEASLAAWTWAEVEARSGIDEATIRSAATIYANSRATILCWGLGLTQQPQSVATVAQLLTLLLLRGNVGKPGAGPLALLGHSNTRGCWTMGLEPKLPEPARAQLERATGWAIPSKPGLDVVGSIAAMHRGEVDVFVSVGGNLLQAGPDTEHVAEALGRCKLSVHLATKLNRAHLVTGETSLLLPCLARIEAAPGFVSVEDMTGIVRKSVGRHRPAGPMLRSELDILTAIATIAAPDALDWAGLGDPARVRRLIAEAVPGAEGFAEQLERDGALRPELGSASGERTLAIPPAPAVEPAQESGARAEAKPEFLLTTVRSHDQHNTTIYSHGDRERGIDGYRRLVLINLADIRRLGLEPFDQVDLTSHFEGRDRVARKWVAVPHHIPEGTLAAYWPEANVLVATGLVDPRSGTPSYKAVRVTVSASD